MGIGTGEQLIVLDEVDSTNRDALDRATAGAPHGTTVVARRQTAGRGRQGRSWLSGEGALTLSVIVREHGVDGLLPLRAGLAVARAAGAGARVKWPNDVQLDGRKVAGILVEPVPPHEVGDHAAVVGIGVNVAVDPSALGDDDVAARAGSLGLPLEELDRFRDRVLVELTDALSLDAPTVVASLASRDALAGRAIAWTASEGGERSEGHAEGIEADGRLKVRLAGGELLHLSGGEVHLL